MGRRRRSSFDVGTRAGRAAFYKSAMWLDFRAAILRENPWCRRCWSEGRTRPTRDVHHRKRLAEHPELALDESNAEALCKPHHSLETRKEMG